MSEKRISEELKKIMTEYEDSCDKRINEELILHATKMITKYPEQHAKFIYSGLPDCHCLESEDDRDYWKARCIKADEENAELKAYVKYVKEITGKGRHACSFRMWQKTLKQTEQEKE